MYSENYYELIKRLELFIRRYYLSRIIKGGLFVFSAGLLLWFFFFLAEYYAFFPGSVRLFLLLVGIALPVIAFGYYVLWPGLQLFKISSGLTPVEAATVISNHFSEMDDKLLNILQLADNSQNCEDQSLYLAAIDQKAEIVKPFDFSRAVALLPPKKFNRGLLVVFLFVASSVSLRPDMVVLSAERIVKFQDDFSPPAPFSFRLISGSGKYFRGEPIEVEVAVVGEKIPDEVSLVCDAGEYVMKRSLSTGNFLYTFKSLNSNMNFFFEASGVKSEEHLIEIVNRPVITSIVTRAVLPAYLRGEEIVVQGTGDITVPSGSAVKWTVSYKGDASVSFESSGLSFKETVLSNNTYLFSRIATSSFVYKIYLIDNNDIAIDSGTYTCQVVADLAPTIQVVQESDSITPELFFFSGRLSDDHGINNLLFYVQNADDPEDLQHRSVSIDKGSLDCLFYYSLSLDTLNLKQGTSYRAWFALFDNNTATGPGVARSPFFHLRKFSNDELRELSRQINEASIERMNQVKRLTTERKNQVNSLEYRIKSESTTSWIEKEELKQIVHEQLNSVDELQKLKEKLQKEALIREKISKESHSVLENKRQELMNLMQQVLDPETIQKMRELQSLIDSLSNKQLNTQIEDIKRTLDRFEENLDRNLELFKELFLQKEILDISLQIKELAKQQRDLIESDESDMPKSEQAGQQKDVKDSFDKMKSRLDSLEQQRMELGAEPFNDKVKDLVRKIDQALKDIQARSGSSRKDKKLSSDQKETADNMDELSNELEKMIEEEESESLDEAVGQMRTILQNVMEASYNQEELLLFSSEVVPGDPNYPTLATRQLLIKESVSAMKDSLVLLSKKSTSIPPFLFPLFDELLLHMSTAIDNHSKSVRSGFAINQRSALTNLNQLGLLLSESLSQMQKQSQMNQMSSGSCKNSKPKKGGKGKPNLNSLKQAQQQLNRQIQEMMQSGKSKGKEGKDEKSRLSEQFSRMAMEQSLIRRELESYSNSLEQETGVKDEDLKKIAQDMEKSESDLIYQKVSSESLQRQEKILSRLLQSERAEQEREEEKRRESRSGNVEMEGNPFRKMGYKDDKRMAEDIYLRENLRFKPYFRAKVIRFEHNTVN